MKAIIMAGGEGSRLRPLTCDCPKPMMRLLDRPVMEYALKLLKKHGVREAAVTLGYLPDAIADYAWQANETAENIGARRLHTLLEKILNDIAFNAGGGDAPEVEVKVDAEYVRGQLSDDMQSKDVKKYIL